MPRFALSHAPENTKSNKNSDNAKTQTDHDAGLEHAFPFYAIAKGFVLNNEMITVIGYVSSSLHCTRFISM